MLFDPTTTRRGLSTLAKAVRAAIHDRLLEDDGVEPILFVDADVVVGALIAPLDYEETSKRVESRSLRLMAQTLWASGAIRPTYVSWAHLSEIERKVTATAKEYRGHWQLDAGFKEYARRRGPYLIDTLTGLVSGFSANGRLSSKEVTELAQLVNSNEFALLEAMAWRSIIARNESIRDLMLTIGDQADFANRLQASKHLWPLAKSLAELHISMPNRVTAPESQRAEVRKNHVADAAAILNIAQVRQAYSRTHHVRLYTQTDIVRRLCSSDDLAISLLYRSESGKTHQFLPGIDDPDSILRSSRYIYLRSSFGSLMFPAMSSELQSQASLSINDLEHFADAVLLLAQNCPDETLLSEYMATSVKMEIPGTASDLINLPAQISFTDNVWLRRGEKLLENLARTTNMPPPENAGLRNLSAQYAKDAESIQNKTILDIDAIAESSSLLAAIVNRAEIIQAQRNRLSLHFEPSLLPLVRWLGAVDPVITDCCKEFLTMSIADQDDDFLGGSAKLARALVNLARGEVSDMGLAACGAAVALEIGTQAEILTNLVEFELGKSTIPAHILTVRLLSLVLQIQHAESTFSNRTGYRGAHEFFDYIIRSLDLIDQESQRHLAAKDCAALRHLASWGCFYASRALQKAKDAHELAKRINKFGCEYVSASGQYFDAYSEILMDHAAIDLFLSCDDAILMNTTETIGEDYQYDDLLNVNQGLALAAAIVWREYLVQYSETRTRSDAKQSFSEWQKSSWNFLKEHPAFMIPSFMMEQWREMFRGDIGSDLLD
ncbi:MAG: hypothetical protein DHS20C16_36710 [Phycisphaerae bacterium]|nr:MAG: hypothetical protein DHS20C16_36710 [Phycisphaerae bacterium]